MIYGLLLFLLFLSLLVNTVHPMGLEGSGGGIRPETIEAVTKY